jgi:hypothetical protein
MFRLSSEARLCGLGVLAVIVGRGPLLAQGQSPNTSPAHEEDRLTSILSVGAGRQSIRGLLLETARELSVPLVVASEVKAEDLAKEIELELRYVQGWGVLSWVSMLSGLSLHLVDGVLVADVSRRQPGLLAVVEQAGMGLPGDHREDQLREDLLERLASIDLEDASISRAAETIRSTYHVDLIVATEVMNRQALVGLHGNVLSLREAIKEICRQTDSTWSWRYGAVWIHDPATDPGPEELGPGFACGQQARLGEVRPTAPRCRLNVRKTALGTLLTHLHDGGVNTQEVGHSHDGRVITLEASGTAGELGELIEALPGPAKPLP